MFFFCPFFFFFFFFFEENGFLILLLFLLEKSEKISQLFFSFMRHCSIRSVKCIHDDRHLITDFSFFTSVHFSAPYYTFYSVE